MKVTIYNTFSGEITRTLDTPAGDLHLQYDKATHNFIEGYYSDALFYISNNVPTEKPASPSSFHIFNWQTKQWYDPRTLANIKTVKNLQINESRLKANRTSFTFNGKQIAADALSRSDIDAMHGIVLLNNEMPVGWQGGWKAIDNTYVAIPDVATWSLFYTAMVAQGQANFAHSQELKATLAAATTIEEVEAITWLI